MPRHHTICDEVIDFLSVILNGLKSDFDPASVTSRFVASERRSGGCGRRGHLRRASDGGFASSRRGSPGRGITPPAEVYVLTSLDQAMMVMVMGRRIGIGKNRLRRMWFSKEWQRGCREQDRRSASVYMADTGSITFSSATWRKCVGGHGRGYFAHCPCNSFSTPSRNFRR